jgi:hypothetical protein
MPTHGMGMMIMMVETPSHAYGSNHATLASQEKS